MVLLPSLVCELLAYNSNWMATRSWQTPRGAGTVFLPSWGLNPGETEPWLSYLCAKCTRHWYRDIGHGLFPRMGQTRQMPGSWSRPWLAQQITNCDLFINKLIATKPAQVHPPRSQWTCLPLLPKLWLSQNNFDIHLFFSKYLKNLSSIFLGVSSASLAVINSQIIKYSWIDTLCPKCNWTYITDCFPFSPWIPGSSRLNLDLDHRRKVSRCSYKFCILFSDWVLISHFYFNNLTVISFAIRLQNPFFDKRRRINEVNFLKGILSRNSFKRLLIIEIIFFRGRWL